MPEKPVFDSTEKFGKTLGFTKAIGNLCLYRPDTSNPNKYTCNSSTLSQYRKWTGREIDTMMQNYFKDNRDLLMKRESALVEEQQQLERAPTQTDCNINISIMQPLQMKPVDNINQSPYANKIKDAIKRNGDIQGF